MRIPSYKPAVVLSAGSGPLSKRAQNQAGSAVLIIFILLSLMGALVVSNLTVLRRMKVELELLDQKQQKRLEISLPPSRAGSLPGELKTQPAPESKTSTGGSNDKLSQP